jgi:hypothetical protein
MSAVTVTLSLNNPDWLTTGLYVLTGLVNVGVVVMLYRKTGDLAEGNGE